MGAIYWQFQTVWQSPSWATIDYSGNWKVSHNFVQRIFQDTIVTTYKQNNSMHIWTVNDHGGFNARIKIKLFTFDQKNSEPKRELFRVVKINDAGS
jgi:beta-mannosidase